MFRLTSLAALVGLLVLSISAFVHSTVSIANHNALLKRHTFVTDVPAAFAVSSTNKRPARDVAVDLAASLAKRSTDFSVRDDSYFDVSHGVWHVYVAQRMHGVSIFNAGLHAVVAEDGESCCSKVSVWPCVQP